jgi:hypothetical protein
MTECRNCGEEIRPAGPGDHIDEADREYYAWVSRSGNPICITLTHEPKAAESEPDVWVVIVEDRHDDVDARPFTTEKAAVAECRRVAEASVHGDCEIEEDELNKSALVDGWVLSLTYCTEGDSVRAVKRRMNAAG